MKIKHMPVSEVSRWPVNTTRFLLPAIAIRGFANGPMRLTFAFWKWRIDFCVYSTSKHHNQHCSG